MSGQLSFPVMLGVLVGSGCSHDPAVAASGWHQTAHSSEALGPATSVSTIGKTAARNTSMLTCLKGKTRARFAEGGGRKFPMIPAVDAWTPAGRRKGLRYFAAEVPKIPHPRDVDCDAGQV